MNYPSEATRFVKPKIRLSYMDTRPQVIAVLSAGYRRLVRETSRNAIDNLSQILCISNRQAGPSKYLQIRNLNLTPHYFARESYWLSLYKPSENVQ